MQRLFLIPMHLGPLCTRFETPQPAHLSRTRSRRTPSMVQQQHFICVDESSGKVLRLIHKSRGHVHGSSHICLRLSPIELSPMICKSALAIALSLLSCAALCQTEGGTLPAETPLALRIDEHLPMRNGQPVRAHLIYPVYGTASAPPWEATSPPSTSPSSASPTSFSPTGPPSPSPQATPPTVPRSFAPSRRRPPREASSAVSSTVSSASPAAMSPSLQAPRSLTGSFSSSTARFPTIPSASTRAPPGPSKPRTPSSFPRSPHLP